MRRIVRLNFTLAAALLVTILLIVSSGRDLSQPNVEYMPDMAYSQAHESFSRSPVFADGVTLQSPPEGTIARGRMPLRYGPTAEEALRAGAELHSPEGVDDRLRGADLFGAFCQPCHGVSGRGDGPIAARGFPPPPPLSADKAVNMADGQLFHIISFGQGNMPAHAAQIDREDRWEVIAHVRRLQERARQASADGGSAGEEGDS